jgi:hypothetical protein
MHPALHNHHSWVYLGGYEKAEGWSSRSRCQNENGWSSRALSGHAATAIRRPGSPHDGDAYDGTPRTIGYRISASFAHGRSLSLETVV